MYGVIHSNVVLMEDLKVEVAGKGAKKMVPVSEGGMFEFPAVLGEVYDLSVRSPSHTKMNCAKQTVKVEKDAVNEVVVKCEVKTTGEMEVVNGGSFALLAVVVVAIFVYVEREKLRKVF